MGLSAVPGIPKLRPGRAVVAAVAVVLLVVAVAVAIVRPGNLAAEHHRHRLATSDGSGRQAGGRTTAPAGQARTVNAQIRVSGTVSNLGIDGANVDRLPTPLTINSPARGEGNGATITGALIGGQRESLAWDAGQPLVIQSNGGGLVLEGGSVQVNATGSAVQLGGLTLSVVPGSYHIPTSVAVSSGGIPSPQDEADFTADGQTEVSFQGQESVPLPMPVHVTGPGKVLLTGDLQVMQSGHRTAPAKSVALTRDGPFVIDLSPGGAGPTISATLRGGLVIQ